MSKVTKSFSFPYPLKHKVVRDLKIVTETIGVMQVNCIGYEDTTALKTEPYDRYAVDVEAVIFDGVDVRPVLEVTGGLDDVTEAAIRYFASQQDSLTNKTAA